MQNSGRRIRLKNSIKNIFLLHISIEIKKNEKKNIYNSLLSIKRVNYIGRLTYSPSVRQVNNTNLLALIDGNN